MDPITLGNPITLGIEEFRKSAKITSGIQCISDSYATYAADPMTFPESDGSSHGSSHGSFLESDGSFMESDGSFLGSDGTTTLLCVVAILLILCVMISDVPGRTQNPLVGAPARIYRMVGHRAR